MATLRRYDIEADSEEAARTEGVVRAAGELGVERDLVRITGVVILEGGGTRYSVTVEVDE